MALALCDTKTDSHGRELTEHGSALFPAGCYHDDLAKEPVPWHWHDELEVLVVPEGTAVIAVESEKYTVLQGEGFFINAGVLHAAWDRDDSGCRFHSVVFHPRLVGGSIDSVFWQDYIRPLIQNTGLKCLHLDGRNAWHREAAAAIEEAWKSCEAEPPGYEFQARSALSRLVFLLSSHHPAAADLPSEKALRDETRIKIMLRYIQEHYAEELSTAMIAASASLSESECLRCFRHTISTPPIQYLKQYRIQKAAGLLAASDQKIAEIGAQCGSQDTSYFTKTFREEKGCTPTEYRRKSRVTL